MTRSKNRSQSKTAGIRVLLAGISLLTMSSCTSGINAGKDGWLAWIAMAIMLILAVIILWFVLGREE